MDAVDHVLVQRARQQRGGRLWGGLAAAALLHAAAFAAALFVASWKPTTPQLDFVPVTIIPAQALGVERPRARPRPPAPAPPAPAAAEPPSRPEPEAKPVPPEPKPKPLPRVTEHEIPPEVDRRPVLHNVQEQLLPKPRAKPEAPKGPARPAAAPSRAPAPPSRGPAGPGGVADVGKGDEAGRRGSAAGNPLGSSAFGSSIAGLEDPDFGYGYYIDRLLQLIDANWTRPPVGGEVKAVVSFRIQKKGAVTDVKIAQSSGYNAFDLAALRAVENAAPFPNLPASYRHDSLGVNLIVH